MGCVGAIVAATGAVGALTGALVGDLVGDLVGGFVGALVGALVETGATIGATKGGWTGAGAGSATIVKVIETIGPAVPPPLDDEYVLAVTVCVPYPRREHGRMSEPEFAQNEYGFELSVRTLVAEL